MGRMTCLALALVVLAWFPGAPATAAPLSVGAVKTLYGQVIVIRNGFSQPLELGSPVFEGDHLETFADGHVGITFHDSTRISLGPASKLDLARVLFLPEEKRYGLLLRLLTGTLDYLSGMMEKLAPDAISIETPTSTIAVRGTHLLIRAGG